MGSYDVTGGLSGLSLSCGDKCVFFPLYPNSCYDNGILEHVTNLVSNDGAYIFYAPFTLPIVGYYDDYGSCKNIEENLNTALIEEFFHCSIQDFMEEITDKRKKYILKNRDVMNKLGGMFEDYRVYIKMSEKNKEVDLDVGEFGSMEKEFEYYSKQLRESKIEEIDKNENNFNLFTRRKGYFAHHFELFWYKFVEIYGDTIKLRFLKEDFVRYSYFYWAMLNCNKFFFPSINRGSFGDYKPQLKLTKIVLNILKQNIKNIEKEREEDF